MTKEEAFEFIQPFVDYGGSTDFDGLAEAIMLLANSDTPAQCPICASEEPRTGTCGSSDPRALCNIAAPSQAENRGEAAASAPRECRHCGWMCTPNSTPSKSSYVLAAPRDEIEDK